MSPVVVRTLNGDRNGVHPLMGIVLSILTPIYIRPNMDILDVPAGIGQ
jgi:hypothetical protein